MIVQDRRVKGGIAAVTNGYYGSRLEKEYDITYVESYCDGTKARKLLKALSGYMAFLFVMLKNRPDLVHMHSSFGPSFYRSVPFIIMSGLSRVPLINHIHGSEFDKLYTDAPAWKKRLIRFMWGKCARVIVLTDDWKEKLSAAVSPDKIRVVGNYGVMRPARSADGTSKHRILFLGLFTKLKGVLDAVSVMRLVIKEVPDAVLYMAGEGELLDEVKKRTEEEGLKEHIRFPGWVRGARKEKLLKGCDIFYLPSYTEALPMSVLEAFGYGLPVVSCNAGGIPKLVRDGETGLLCVPGDIDAQADALIKLLKDPGLCARLRTNAYDKLKGSFSLDRHIDSLSGVYREVI